MTGSGRVQSSEPSAASAEEGCGPPKPVGAGAHGMSSTPRSGSATEPEPYPSNHPSSGGTYPDAPRLGHAGSAGSSRYDPYAPFP